MELPSFDDLCVLAKEGLQARLKTQFQSFPEPILMMICDYAIYDQKICEIQFRKEPFASEGGNKWRCLTRLCTSTISICDLVEILMRSLPEPEGFHLDEEAEHEFWLALCGDETYLISQANKFPCLMAFWREWDRYETEEGLTEPNLKDFISPEEIEDLYDDFDEFVDKVRSSLRDCQMRIMFRSPYCNH